MINLFFYGFDRDFTNLLKSGRRLFRILQARVRRYLTELYNNIIVYHYISTSMVNPNFMNPSFRAAVKYYKPTPKLTHRQDIMRLYRK